jgi:pimeloyl-ACP methyl ester carboxylesterase
MAEVVAGIMEELGYDRYVASGGDIGSSVAEALAAAQPDRVSALRLSDIPYRHLFTVDPSGLSGEEQSYLEAGQGWAMSDGAYALEQSTRPSCATGATATVMWSRPESVR